MTWQLDVSYILMLQTIEELEEEIGAHHATLIPLIFNLMSDSNPEIQKSSTNALDAILLGLGEEINQYLPGLMAKLVSLMDNGSPKVRGSVIACIGSAANASGDVCTIFFCNSSTINLTQQSDDRDLHRTSRKLCLDCCT